jgi:integrase
MLIEHRQRDVGQQRGQDAALRRAGQGVPLIAEFGEDPGLEERLLRHTGNNLAAATGASTKELMVRMGHSTMRAALIYQHATRERDRKIADGLSEQIKAARRAPTTDTSAGADGHATGTGSAGGA